jgi:protein farnesyltransferase subunit beta
VIVADLTAIATLELHENVASFIAQCQTYEGGLGGQPFAEAHGGYTFCGIATLGLIKRLDAIHLPRLLHWACQRQMSVEGGFSGRGNKLVDGCYAYWLAALFPIIHQELKQMGYEANQLIFDSEALAHYLLDCAQKETGGFTDRYDRSADFYHTCYCLSGLAITGYVKDMPPTDPIFNLRISERDLAKSWFEQLNKNV